MDFFSINLLLMIFHGFGYKFLYPKKRRRKIFICVATIQNILLMGLRNYNEVGVDLVRYLNAYNIIKNLKFANIFYNGGEKYSLWRILNYFFGHLGIKYEVFLLCIAIFVVSLMGWFIYKYSQNVVLGYFIYLGMGVYTFQYSGLKQTLSMAFILLCYDAEQEQKYFKTIVFLVVALLFHPTAMIFCAYLVGKRIKINSLTLLLAFVAIYIIYYNRMILGSFIVAFFADEYVGYYSISNEIGNTTVFLFLVLILYIFSNFKSIRKISSIENSALYLLGISIAVQILSSYSYAFSRLNLYYIQFAPIYIPIALNGNGLKILKTFYKPSIWIMWGLMMGIMIMQYFSHLNNENLLPYVFIWDSII